MSSILSLILCKCPNCGKTDMFQHSSLNILKFIKMNNECSDCKQNFHPEPGYYLGAMYISYVINSFIFLGFALTSTFYFEHSLTLTLSILGLLSLVLLPFTLRFSRTLWLKITNDVEK